MQEVSVPWVGPYIDDGICAYCASPVSPKRAYRLTRDMWLVACDTCVERFTGSWPAVGEIGKLVYEAMEQRWYEDQRLRERERGW